MSKQTKKITLDGLGATVDRIGVTVKGLGTTVEGLNTTVNKLGVTVNSLGTTVGTLSSKVDKLASAMEVGFKRLEGKMDKGFKEVRQEMSIGFKKAEENRESLARMVASGFEQTSKNISGLKDSMITLEQGQENIQLRVDSLAPQFEVRELTRRVKRLENRAGIRNTAQH